MKQASAKLQGKAPTPYSFPVKLFQLHMSFAHIIPEIMTASIPPPGKVDAPTRYNPLTGVLK